MRNFKYLTVLLLSVGVGFAQVKSIPITTTHGFLTIPGSVPESKELARNNQIEFTWVHPNQFLGNPPSYTQKAIIHQDGSMTIDNDFGEPLVRIDKDGTVWTTGNQTFVIDQLVKLLKAVMDAGSLK